jgi:hypothetical protein
VTSAVKTELVKLTVAAVAFTVGLILALSGVVTVGTPNGVFATIPMAFGAILSLAIVLRLYLLRRKRRRAQAPTEDS